MRIWLELDGKRVGLTNLDTAVRLMAEAQGTERRRTSDSAMSQFKDQLDTIERGVLAIQVKLFGELEGESEKGRLPAVERAVHDVRNRILRLENTDTGQRAIHGSDLRRLGLGVAIVELLLHIPWGKMLQ